MNPHQVVAGLAAVLLILAAIGIGIALWKRRKAPTVAEEFPGMRRKRTVDLFLPVDRRRPYADSDIPTTPMGVA